MEANEVSLPNLLWSTRRAFGQSMSLCHQSVGVLPNALPPGDRLQKRLHVRTDVRSLEAHPSESMLVLPSRSLLFTLLDILLSVSQRHFSKGGQSAGRQDLG
jgi:hypothetical protein